MNFDVEEGNFFNFHGIKLADCGVLSPEIRRSIAAGNYESREMEYVLSNAEESDIILELGAGIGAMSSMILAHTRVRGYVCVEAMPELVAVIKKNHRLNNIPACEIVAGVMINKAEPEEWLDFHIYEDFWENSLQGLEGRKALRTVRIKGYDFAEQLRKYAPSFIVCDIEGGEFQLFTGGVDLSHVNKVCIEVHDATPKELIDLYAFFVDQGLYLKTPPLRAGVHFFSRGNKGMK